MNHLVLVPGHAVWSGAGDPRDSSTWFLKPHQSREARFFLEHLRAGVQIAARDPLALLVLSGAATDAAAAPRTEARGYFDAAERLAWFGCPAVRLRAALEEWALDSFLNLLYALCRFREIAGSYPLRITVAGWGFKSRRFAVLHRAALRWRRPFEALAVNDPEDLPQAVEREADTFRRWEADPYGAFPPLSAKRLARAHAPGAPSYARSCPELAALLNHKGPSLFDGPLPWDDL
jgi:hypothetical protein